MTNIYSVSCGEIKYISNASNPLDATGELLDKTFPDAIMGTDIIVVDMMTGECSQFDTNEILTELGFEFEE